MSSPHPDARDLLVTDNAEPRGTHDITAGLARARVALTSPDPDVELAAYLLDIDPDAIHAISGSK